MGIWSSVFTWWNGQTVGTWLHTALHGRSVGDDDQGNKYYQDKAGKRRWVIYNGPVEASREPQQRHTGPYSPKLQSRVRFSPMEPAVIARSLC